MITKILRTTITSEVMLINEDSGDVVSLIETNPVIIYKDNHFNYEKYLHIVEESTLRAYQAQRPIGDRLNISELLQTPPPSRSK